MRTIGKGAVAAAMAVALLMAGALAFVRSPGATTQVPARTASTSALLVPAVGARSLDETIAALQDRLKALPQDWRGYASLGLAYVAQARVTGDPSWYPKAEGVLARSIRINGGDNVEGALGLGVLDLARHDFASALREGRHA
jgi:cytochrome c-type biogenesis protein CcmH/NrfG